VDGAQLAQLLRYVLFQVHTLAVSLALSPLPPKQLLLFDTSFNYHCHMHHPSIPFASTAWLSCVEWLLLTLRPILVMISSQPTWNSSALSAVYNGQQGYYHAVFVTLAKCVSSLEQWVVHSLRSCCRMYCCKSTSTLFPLLCLLYLLYVFAAV
jgi:hypothetical protein